MKYKISRGFQVGSPTVKLLKKDIEFMEMIDRKHPVEKGYMRQWYKCYCGQMQHTQFIPYSLSDPVHVTVCGHPIRSMSSIYPAEK